MAPLRLLWLLLPALAAVPEGDREPLLIPQGDLMATKVWLDRFVYNSTLRTVKEGPHKGKFKSCALKAKEQGLDPWPPAYPPTLCQLAVGRSSLHVLQGLLQLFPELRVLIFHPEDAEAQRSSRAFAAQALDGLDSARRWLVQERVGLAGFAETCHVVSWSVDTPLFAFRKWAPLFSTVQYPLGLFNLQGCTVDSMRQDVDKYYCEYLYGVFKQSICGQLDEDGLGTSLYADAVPMPLADSECGDFLCMCHTHRENFADWVRDDELVCPGPGVEPAFASQWGQDFFVYHNFFSEDALAGRGMYVDVGASMPFMLSNTAFFDKCLGWRGACVEPNPRLAPLLRVARSCEVLTNCAWRETKEMKFAQGGELAGITDDESLMPAEPFSTPQSDEEQQKTYFKATCRPLKDLLLAAITAVHGEGSRSRRVDLLSVDTEGAEIDIFRDFPFQEWDIRVIVIEASRQTAMALDSLLLPEGFLQVAVLGKDAVYASKRAIQAMRSGPPVLPERIGWNEPGTDEETIAYSRFQRFFGVDGDLDAEVGDQRLQNETEMARQQERFFKWHGEFLDSMRDAVSDEWKADFQRAIKDPEVAALLREPRVKEAIGLLTTNQTQWVELMKRDEGLSRKMQKLMKEKVISLSR